MLSPPASTGTSYRLLHGGPLRGRAHSRTSATWGCPWPRSRRWSRAPVTPLRLPTPSRPSAPARRRRGPVRATVGRQSMDSSGRSRGCDDQRHDHARSASIQPTRSSPCAPPSRLTRTKGHSGAVLMPCRHARPAPSPGTGVATATRVPGVRLRRRVLAPGRRTGRGGAAARLPRVLRPDGRADHAAWRLRGLRGCGDGARRSSPSRAWRRPARCSAGTSSVRRSRRIRRTS